MSVPNGAGWLQVFLGIMAAGAIPAPIDPSEPEEAQVAAARSIGAACLWREGRAHALAGSPGTRPRSAAECLVKMTSGSSGTPRGLAATHAQMEADGRQICVSMGIGPRDANLAAIPLGYSYGLGNLVVPLMVQGTSLICVSSALPHAIAADALAHAPTVFPAVPPILSALAASDLQRRSFSSLRLVISAGSPLSPEIAASFEGKFGVRIHGFYGTSETGGIAFDSRGPERRRADRRGPYRGRQGRPVHRVERRGHRGGWVLACRPREAERLRGACASWEDRPGGQGGRAKA
jgi:acyl-CoA synthetase (AMP-forming)/AMP-acid ligase II